MPLDTRYTTTALALDASASVAQAQVAGLSDALLSAAALDRRPVTAAGRPPRVPPGVKLCGGNVVPSPDQVINEGTHGSGGWRRFWVEWDWPAIKAQIDRAAALRMNGIRIIGNLSGVVFAQHPLADLLAKYDQLIDYCRSLGMYYYACLGGSGDWSGANNAQLIPVMAAVAAHVGRHPNVIGIDVIQEFVHGFPGGPSVAQIVADYVAPTHAAVSAACDLPLTYSLSGGNTGEAMWADGSIALVDPYCDYFDGHAYYTGALANEVSNTLAAFGKSIVIGECGANQAMSSADRAARYRFFRSLCERHDVVGGFAWALADQHTDPSIQWGLAGATGTLRADVTSVLSTFPRVARPWRDVVPIVGTGTITGAGYAVPPGMNRTYWTPVPVVARISVHAHLWNDAGGDSVFNLQVRVNTASTIGPGLTVPMRSGESWRMVSWQHNDLYWEPGQYTVDLFCGRVSGGGTATLQADTKLIVELIPVG